jgi:hypothetical protein
MDNAVLAAERIKDLHRQAATQRRANRVRHMQPVRRSRPHWPFIAVARTASR